ncbi:chitotriosidase-1-like [Topomyia yanbarensis]|uniref:chitotriosidase-1-like n=1 Tax=Topomyia yanbarensis TaxID=2498891 RepID=UPI00273C9A84|nr:chitotriosidase-1-like [Topomyia yanbarensis]
MIGISFLLLVFNFFHESSAQNVICYYDSSAASLDNPLTPENLSVANCTHYTYIGLGLTAKGDLRLLHESYDKTTGFSSFQNLRSSNAKLLVLLGGIYESSSTFSNVVGTYPDTLINNIALFLNRYNFDGIDIDWRYPASRGGKAADKANFQKFVIRLRARLNMINKLLVISVSPTKSIFTAAYDSITLSLYADMINVYAFNFTETIETKTANLAPMYSNSANPISVNSSIVDWLSTKVRKSKINIGVATYARTYTLTNATKNILGSAVSGPGTMGPNSKQAGYLAQYEFCSLSGAYFNTTDVATQTIYYTKDSSWISTETADTLIQKFSYVLDNALGGVAIYTLDWDDWSNGCGAGEFPAAALAQQYFNYGSSSP